MTDETVHVACPCGWEMEVDDARYTSWTDPLESATKRAAAHSGHCDYDYKQIEIES